MKEEEIKISVPIISNLELKELDYNIEKNYETIVDQVSKAVSRDREIIILQQIIKNQDEQIRKLRNCHLRYEEMTGIDLLLED